MPQVHGQSVQVADAHGILCVDRRVATGVERYEVGKISSRNNSPSVTQDWGKDHGKLSQDMRAYANRVS